MVQVTLRKLATQYADGTLAKEEYRKSRTALLEGILSGEIELQVNDYLPPVILNQNTFNIAINEQPAAEDGDITQFNAETQPPPPPPVVKKNNRKQKPVIIGASLLVIIVLVIAFLPDPKPSKTASTEQSAPVNAIPGKAQTLIQDFLEKKDWSDLSLDTFKTQWQALTTEQQARATGSIQLSRLTNSIYKKLLEERALSGLSNDEEVLSKQRKLLAFAKNIGIKDSRLRLPKGTTP